LVTHEAGDPSDDAVDDTSGAGDIGPWADTTSWRTVGEVVLAAELCLLAASPFVDLFAPAVVPWRLLVAGLAALVPGLLLRIRGARPSLLLSVLISFVVFLFAAAICCFADVAVAGFVPGPDVLGGIRSGLVDGSRQILTSAVPAPSTGEMLLIPFALVFWAVTAVAEVTWRTRTRLVAPAVAVALFAVALSFQPAGADEDLLIAAAIAGLALLYVLARNRSSTAAIVPDGTEDSRRPIELGRTATFAVVGIAALIGVAIALASVVPVQSDRLALRDSVQEPVEPVEQLNPLLLVNPVQRGDVTPTAVLDLSTPDPDLDLVRLPIGRLDTYDCAGGFDASTDAVASADVLPPLASNPSTTVMDITLVSAESRVLPAPGNVVAASVEDGRQIYSDPADRLLVLSATPIDGAHYRVRTAIPADVSGESSFAVGATTSANASVVQCEELAQVDLQRLANQIGLLQGDGQDRLQTLAGWCQGLRADPETVQGDDLSLGRLFGTGSAEVPSVIGPEGGSAAQVVTACAALGQAAGLPVQVAVGYVADVDDGNGAVTTSDLSTWLEVRDVDGLFHPVPVLGEPDPSAGNPPETSSDQDQTGDRDVSPPPSDPAEFQPSVPEEDRAGAAPWALLLAGLIVTVVGAVAWRATGGARRRRRRRSGSPAERLSGAWMEAVDTLGSVGVVADAFGPEDIARTADAFPTAREPLQRLGELLATTFAPSPPTAERAEAAWVAVDQLRRALRAGRTSASGPAQTGAQHPEPERMEARP
jgi:hypothetical protein